MDLIQIIQHQIMLNYMKAQSEALQTEFLPAGKFQTSLFENFQKKSSLSVFQHLEQHLTFKQL